MKKILVVASLLCLFACQHKQENKVESVDANTLAIDSLTNLPEQKIKEIRYIPLETNDDILIGGVSTVRYVNGYFYFISSQKILVFDKQGKFAYCIDKVGQGPGEYTSAWGVDVNPQGDVYVADTSVGKVIKSSVAILKNKKTGELTKPNFFSGKIRSYQQVNGATDNCLLFLTSSESENIEYILEHDTDMLPEEREALSQLSEDDNPVLMLLKF